MCAFVYVYVHVCECCLSVSALLQVVVVQAQHLEAIVHLERITQRSCSLCVRLCMCMFVNVV